MTTQLPTFKKLQYGFTAHIRNPDKHPAPEGIEERRMSIYRELIFNNVEDFIASSFPVLRKLYNDQDWYEMVRNFLIQHQCHSPYFLEISDEFLKYLQNEHQNRACDPPYLLELAHYEWIEIPLSVAEEKIDITGINPNSDLLDGQVVVSSLACLLSYKWPVHRISPDYQPEQAPEQATHIIVYRDRKDEIRFLEVNPVTARLVNIIEENPNLIGKAALQIIIDEMQHPNPDLIFSAGQDALEELKQLGIILGTKIS